MNAIDLLKADHERVKGILTQLSESTERGVKKRGELLAKLEMEIAIHTRLEKKSGTRHTTKPGARSRTSCITKPTKNIAPLIPWCCHPLKSPAIHADSRSRESGQRTAGHHSDEEETEMFLSPRSCWAKPHWKSWGSKWKV